jgi:hypothetical protein
VALALVPSSLAAPPSLGGCQIFPANHIFNTRIDSLPVHPQSAAFIQTINSGTRYLHMDLGQTEDMTSSEYWGIPYNLVHASTYAWQPVSYSQGYPDESDCAGTGHSVASPCVNTATQPLMPIPPSPLVEGGIVTDQSNYGDHHMLMVDGDACMLWEAYHSYPDPTAGWDIYSSAAWDLHSNALRPAGWTSTDAAGFPVFPLLMKEDEASTGQFNHAMRFTIKSSKIRNSYTWPARHLTTNGDDSSSKPPMGQLFRLKASYVIPASFPVQAKAILTAMKQYGMYIADGGSDMYVQGDPNVNWSSDTISAVQTVPHTAFEAVDLSSIAARPGFNPDSAAVPPAPGAFSITPTLSGNASSLSLSVAINVASADAGQSGQLYVAALFPATNQVYCLTAQGWQAVNGLALLPYANVTLGSHTITITNRLNVSGLVGLQVYAGYGLNLPDMLNGQKYLALYANRQ